MRPNANPLSHVVQKPIAPPEISFLQAQGKLPWLRSIYTFPNITLTSLISMKVEWNVYFKHFITITSFTNLESSLHLWHALPLSSCPFQLGHFSYGFIGFVSDQLHPGFNLNLTISKNNPTLRLNASKYQNQQFLPQNLFFFFRIHLPTAPSRKYVSLHSGRLGQKECRRTGWLFSL